MNQVSANQPMRNQREQAMLDPVDIASVIRVGLARKLAHYRFK
jgi:hypothetical protein